MHINTLYKTRTVSQSSEASMPPVTHMFQVAQWLTWTYFVQFNAERWSTICLQLARSQAVVLRLKTMLAVL